MEIAGTWHECHLEKKAAKDVAKWQTMIGQGISSFMVSHPGTFRRRLRRGIPEDYRWTVWKLVIRSEIRMRARHYSELCQESNKWTRAIELDIPRTFPEVASFDEDHQRSLLRVLTAYANHDKEVGYCQGMNFVAGLLLLVSGNREEEVFWTFVCLMDEGRLSGFYKRRFPLLRRYLWAFDQLMADALPEVQRHFFLENVHHPMYLHQWFLTLFINCLPMPMVLILWDSIICIGLDTLLLIALSLLKMLSKTLVTLQLEDIVTFFKMMRISNDEDGMTSIGRMIIAESANLQIPAFVLSQLNAEESDADDVDESATDDDGLSPEHKPTCVEKQVPFGDSAVLPFSMGPAVTPMLEPIGDYFVNLPSDVYSWWEETLHDNLQRVRLAAPYRLLSGT